MSEVKLPSLNALRAFAVVGAHLNLKTAAEALFVTPSALSHQIRGLEQHLDMQLFHRNQHGLKLTIAGEKLLPDVQEAFKLLSDSINSLQAKAEQHVLTVSMLSTFAMRWFIPRLARFQQLHPDIEVRISTSIEPVDFKREDVDCAIRSGHGNWPELHVDKLFSEQLTPVCSPEIQLLNTEALRSQTLLHARLRPDDWHIWLHSAGADGLRAAHEQTYETRNFAIQAAIDGLGIAIVDPALVKDELLSGRLIQPFAQSLPSENAYHLVSPPEREPSVSLQAFRIWLLNEARK
ncbi:LysR family transcriptional regulator, glycine cleavage system transcriptional activator [Mariprofundus micogutta]|uniref:LysR family transcriptional regulator, glycine cleavage system transcriptional activator n=1 Tax=Mariprofundus micogutta TaxID=1921010 RepID=A0A1L8CM21_9PROT|nr:transcriptional regulator GcvA [Mariprofundus micogutta]GAV19935.1 LysR family transcriptional regulator, glycine cleavage system transcriptional activator [Mariprofundus micogutta]